MVTNCCTDALGNRQTSACRPNSFHLNRRTAKPAAQSYTQPCRSDCASSSTATRVAGDTSTRNDPAQGDSRAALEHECTSECDFGRPHRVLFSYNQSSSNTRLVYTWRRCLHLKCVTRLLRYSRIYRPSHDAQVKE